MLDDSQADFFVVLGYLASNERQTKLDIETHPNQQVRIEYRYHTLTGISLVPSANYYVWSADANKWGSELRIYFHMNDNIPQQLNRLVVSSRFQNSYHNARINDNDFVWKLIEYGFRVEDNQDVSRIATRIPNHRQADFRRGLVL
jgi:hypothetical protein